MVVSKCVPYFDLYLCASALRFQVLSNTASTSAFHWVGGIYIQEQPWDFGPQIWEKWHPGKHWKQLKSEYKGGFYSWAVLSKQDILIKSIAILLYHLTEFSSMNFNAVLKGEKIPDF